MDDYKFNTKQVVEIDRHPDYEKNLNWGSKFTHNYNGSHDGRYFSMKMTPNLDGLKYYFSFSFTVPHEYGNHPSYGNPVNPNQNYEIFMKEFKGTFCAYSTLQKKWDKASKDFAAFSVPFKGAMKNEN